MFDWPLMKDAITEDDKNEMIKFISSTDRFTNGPKVREFEKEWSKWLGSKYSLFVSSGSTANSLLVAAVKELYKLNDGDRVLVPACTWTTNICPIIQNNLEPVFCDINLDNYSFDLTKRYDNIKMIFVTHLLGQCAPMVDIKNAYPNAIIIEDICESHGVRDAKNNVMGADSLGATFSFYFGHHMTTIEGGMISTNNKELYELMRIKRSHGMSREYISDDKRLASERENNDVDPKFLFLTDGYNFRANDLFAVIGLSQLQNLSESIRIRQTNYMNFHRITRWRKFLYPVHNYNGNSSFCLQFICKNKEIKEEIKEKLETRSIETRPIVGGNLLRQPVFKKYANYKDFPNAEILHNNGFYIGNNQFVTREDINKIHDVLSEIDE